MRARLGFSIATAVDPDILLLDEVLQTGDEVFREKSRQRIIEVLRAAKAVVLVTHDMTWVTEFCTRAILLDRGRIVAEGDPGRHRGDARGERRRAAQGRAQEEAGHQARRGARRRTSARLAASARSTSSRSGSWARPVPTGAARGRGRGRSGRAIRPWLSRAWRAGRPIRPDRRPGAGGAGRGGAGGRDPGPALVLSRTPRRGPPREPMLRDQLRQACAAQRLDCEDGSGLASSFEPSRRSVTCARWAARLGDARPRAAESPRTSAAHSVGRQAGRFAGSGDSDPASSHRVGRRA